MSIAIFWRDIASASLMIRAHIAEILLISGLVILNGLFAAAEMALVSVRRVSLKASAEKGSNGARIALGLIQEPSRFLAAIQVGITLAGFMASATAAVSLAGVLSDWLKELGIPWVAGISAGTSVVLVTLAMSYVTLVFGELVPKRLGLSRAHGVAVKVAGPVAFLARLMGPLTWILMRSTDAVARLLGVRGEVRSAVTEEEIKILVAEQAGLLDEEKQMIQEIFDLGDTVAREIMIPRVDMLMLEDSASLAEALEVFRSSGFSRLPVFHDDPDTVVGVLLLKDLLVPATSPEKGAAVADLTRTPVFVPETKPVLPLLGEMQAARDQMVIVLDEYGGTAGLLTIEDIVEEVVGEITDEFDREVRYVTRLTDGDWIVDGRIAVEDAGEVLGVTFPESEEYETLAGWVLKHLGHIPVPGEMVQHGGAEIRIVSVRRRRIAKLRVTVTAPKGEED